MKTSLFALLFAALPGAAGAHVMFAPATFTPGEPYVGALRVTHGCDGAATTSLKIEIPASVTGVKPQAKPGWTITIDHVALDKSYVNGRGKTVTDRVSAITWSGGSVPDEEFDDFNLMLTAPEGAQPVLFRAVQSCGATVVTWDDPPATGKPPQHPAPVLVPATDPHGGMTMPMP